MKIHYLATARIPSKTANSLQIIKMCEAFSLIGHDITLISPNLVTKNSSIKNYYDLKKKFRIYKVGKIKRDIKGIQSILTPLKILRRRQRLLAYHLSSFNDLKAQGYTIIYNYFSEDQCKKAAIDLKKAYENYPAFIAKSEDKRIFGIEQILPVARTLAQDGDFLELGELINQERTYCAFTLGNWLESGKGGSSGDGWHRDAFHSQYKALLYLTDVSEDNGPFELLPGSHHLASVLAGIA